MKQSCCPLSNQIHNISPLFASKTLVFGSGCHLDRWAGSEDYWFRKVFFWICFWQVGKIPSLHKKIHLLKLLIIMYKPAAGGGGGGVEDIVFFFFWGRHLNLLSRILGYCLMYGFCTQIHWEFNKAQEE